IAILAFILAASGLGFGGFSFIYFNNLIPTSTTGEGNIVQNIWYAEYLTHQTPSQHPTYTTLTNMQLVITVNTGESVYISFNAKYTIDNSGSYEYIESYIFQNGTAIPAPYAYVGEVNSESVDSLRMVSLQYSISGLAAGDYDFSIRATTGDNTGDNRIDDTILFIQTYL
ncbi:MAG: hypothetical protein ACTSP9_11590, partial [Promethearchaeota archaeon]